MKSQLFLQCWALGICNRFCFLDDKGSFHCSLFISTSHVLRLFSIAGPMDYDDFDNANNKPKYVVFVYAPGCEYLDRFLYLIMLALRGQNCNVLYDLCSMNEILKSKKGRETYLMEESRKADNVIIAYSGGITLRITYPRSYYQKFAFVRLL